jgi:hypothetical protein
MNDHELNELLRRAQVPDRPSDYWEKFPERAVHRAVAAPQTDSPPARHRGWLFWGLGFAAVCLVIGFQVGLRQGRDTVAAEDQLAEQRKLFHEVAALFPERLRAIVLEAGQVQLILAEDADVPPSPPLLVEICMKGRCRTFITFSGQQLRINGDTYDVLYNADGQVIVAGRSNVWIGSEPMANVGAVEVRARLLEGRT